MVAFKVITILLVVCIAYSQVDAYRNGCYLQSWSQWRQGAANITPAKYPPGLCSHIFYAFTTFNSAFQFSNPNDASYSWIKQFKARDGNAKIIMSIGGASFGGALFNQAVGNSGTFAKNAVAHAKANGFHGIDIDWEPAESVNKGGLVTLLKAVRSAGGSGFIVTAAVAAGSYAGQWYDYAGLAGSGVDFINLMTYDADSWRSNLLGYSAPFNSFVKPSIDYAISKGFPANKISLGVLTVGYGWNTGTANAKVGNGATYWATSPLLKQEKAFGTYELCPYMASGKYDSAQQTTYNQAGQLWLTWESGTSLKVKTDLIKSKGLYGAFVWALDYDDVNNNCKNGRFAVTNYLSNQLTGKAYY